MVKSSFITNLRSFRWFDRNQNNWLPNYLYLVSSKLSELNLQLNNVLWYIHNYNNWMITEVHSFNIWETNNQHICQIVVLECDDCWLQIQDNRWVLQSFFHVRYVHPDPPSCSGVPVSGWIDIHEQNGVENIGIIKSSIMILAVGKSTIIYFVTRWVSSRIGRTWSWPCTWLPVPGEIKQHITIKKNYRIKRKKNERNEGAKKGIQDILLVEIEILLQWTRLEINKKLTSNRKSIPAIAGTSFLTDNLWEALKLCVYIIDVSDKIDLPKSKSDSNTTHLCLWGRGPARFKSSHKIIWKLLNCIY